MANFKCQHKVFDINTRKYRLCKKKPVICKFCKLHLPLIYYKSAILIQSYFKAFRIKNKLFYFRKLPRELQCKILWYMNKTIYIKSMNNSILKIINNKINNYFYNILKTLDNRLPFLNQEALTNNIINSIFIIDFSKIIGYELIKDNLWWNNVMNYENIYKTNLLNDLNDIIKILIKYSLIINNCNYTNKDYINMIYDNIIKIKFILCYIIQIGKRNPIWWLEQNSTYYNYSIFENRKCPDIYIKFSNLYFKNYKTRNYFIHGDIEKLYYEIYNKKYVSIL